MSDKTFAEWFAKECPPGTVISDPAWWAPRIERQARAALLAESPDVEGLAKWHQAMADEPKRNQAKREKHQATADALLSLSAKVRELEEELVKKESVERGSRLVIATQGRALHEIGEKMVELKGHAEMLAEYFGTTGRGGDNPDYEHDPVVAYRRDHPEET